MNRITPVICLVAALSAFVELVEAASPDDNPLVVAIKGEGDVLPALVRVDRLTGAQEVITQGVHLASVTDLIIDPFSNRAIVADSGHLISVNLFSGAQTLAADPPPPRLTGDTCWLEIHGNAIYGSGTLGVSKFDLTTGASTLITPVGGNQGLQEPFEIIAGESAWTGRLLVADPSAGRVFSIDPDSGTASPLNDAHHGLRWLEMTNGNLYALSTDELFVFNPNSSEFDRILAAQPGDMFTALASGEDGNLFLTSTGAQGVDSVYGVDLAARELRPITGGGLIVGPTAIATLAVPEPASSALLCVGVLALTLRRRRLLPRDAESLFEVNNMRRSPRRVTHSVRWAAIVLAACWTSSASAIDRSWNTDNGSWSNAANWSPAGVPSPADLARIGNLVGVRDHTVFGDQDVTVTGIVITDEMALQTQGHLFTILGDTILNGDHTRLNISDAGPGVDFLTHDLSVSGDNARVLLEDATVRVSGLLSIGPGAELTRLFPSDGLINLTGVGGTTFSNGGRVSAGPGHISLVQSFAGLYDLDGPTGRGEIRVSGTSTASVAINGQALFDSFSGTIALGPNAILQMNITDGWEADASSTIEAFHFSSGLFSQLGGDAVRLAGAINVLPTAELRVTADATLAPTANVKIVDDGTLDFDLLSNAVVEGGDYSVGHGGMLRFRGATTVKGGTFDTPTSEFSDGAVHFNGPTDWRGNVTILGAARQGANASVTAPSIITAERFDLGGDRWDVNAPLVINADAVGWGPGAGFVGELNIQGPIFAKLTVNLTGDLQTAWSLSTNSQLNLSGHKALFVNRLAGSPVLNFGETNVSDSKVEISAGMLFMPNAVVNFAETSSELRMRGETYIREGAEFNGEGTLYNGDGGQMWLFNGTTLDDVGLVNDGQLRFRRYGYVDHAALSAVDRFTNNDEGTVQFRLGGYKLGDEFDHLSVTGGSATLDGLIDVVLVNDGDGMFLPQVGDEFTILAAVDGVSGQFLNDPVSHASGQEFHWEVLYHPHDVTLRLSQIMVPEPVTNGMALLSCLLASAARRHS